MEAVAPIAATMRAGAQSGAYRSLPTAKLGPKTPGHDPTPSEVERGTPIRQQRLRGPVNEAMPDMRTERHAATQRLWADPHMATQPDASLWGTPDTPQRLWIASESTDHESSG